MIQTCLDIRRVVLGGDAGVFEVCSAGEGGDVGMRVRSLNRNVEQLARQDVARPIEAACKI